MQYNEAKKRAFIDLQGWVTVEGIDIVTLQGNMMRKYGFSPKMLKAMLEQLENEGAIQVTDTKARKL